MDTREWVGIAALLAAVTIAAMFLFPDDGQGRSPVNVSLGLDPPSPTAQATPTPTPEPITRIGAPGESWRIEFFDLDFQGQPSTRSESIIQTLDLAFPNAPFGDSTDDAWGLNATVTIDLPPGLYTFDLNTQAEVEVSIDDIVIAAQGWSPAPTIFPIRFQHPGGQTTIHIHARDAGGPFLLAWN